MGSCCSGGTDDKGEPLDSVASSPNRKAKRKLIIYPKNRHLKYIVAVRDRGMPVELQAFGLRHPALSVPLPPSARGNNNEESFSQSHWTNFTLWISEDILRLIFSPTVALTTKGHTLPSLSLPADAVRGMFYPYGIVGHRGKTMKRHGIVSGFHARVAVAKPRLLLPHTAANARVIHLEFAPKPNPQGHGSPPIHLNLRFPDRPSFVISLVVIHRAVFPDSEALTRGRILWMLLRYHVAAVVRRRQYAVGARLWSDELWL